MGKVVSKIVNWAFPGGAGHSEDDDLTHNFDSFHSISAKNADGDMIDFKEYKGKVVLVVNSARMWGKSRQIPGTIELYNKYKDQGFEILYFPCKQFGKSTDEHGNRVDGQEPGDIATVQAAYREKFHIPWSIFDFVNVNGPETCDVYKFLRSAELKNQNREKNAVEWNFGKFIVGKDGQVLKRYGPGVPITVFDAEDKLKAWLARE